MFENKLSCRDTTIPVRDPVQALRVAAYPTSRPCGRSGRPVAPRGRDEPRVQLAEFFDGILDRHFVVVVQFANLEGVLFLWNEVLCEGQVLDAGTAGVRRRVLCNPGSSLLLLLLRRPPPLAARLPP